MSIPHINIAIATPANSFTPGYLKSLLRTIIAIEENGLTWTFMSEGGSLVSMARERTIGGWNTDDRKMTMPQNGEFTYDMLMWIDSDIIWEPTDVFRLYRSEHDIISGNYLMEDRMIPIYNNPRGGMMPEQMLLELTEPFEIEAAGFGFIAVKSGVFEKMSRPWFGPVSIPNYDDDKNENPFFTLIGEDISWCVKAKKLGFKIWDDPMVKVIHQKTFQIHWNKK